MPGDGDAICVMCVGQGAPVEAATGDMVASEAPELVAQLEELGLADCFERAGSGTAYAQPAIFCATVAGSRRSPRSATARFAAGHSLGEYSALVVAGALEAVEGLRLVALRGRLMQEAAERAAPNGMLAARAGVADVEEALQGVSGVTIANDNGARQVVLAGELDALDVAGQALQARGIRSTALRVSGAFHHPLMSSAAEEMVVALESVDFRPTRTTVMSGLTGRPFGDVRAELVAGITSRVRWREVMRYVASEGVTQFVDLGPGRILGNLAAKELPEAEHLNVG